jgi:hypothetical protein
MDRSFRHEICAKTLENPAFLTLPCRNGRGAQWVTANMTPVRGNFDRQIQLELHGPTVTSDAGRLAYRELDDALGLTRTAASLLHDTRTGQNKQHSLLALLRQSI